MFLISRRTARPLSLCATALLLSLSHLPARAQAPVSVPVATENKAELVNLVHEFHVNDIWPSKLIAGVDFKLSDAAWKVMLSKEGVNGAARLARNMGDYIKEQGIGDLERIETANNNDRKGNQEDVDELIAEARKKLSVTIEATQPKLSPAKSQLFLNYVSYVGQFLDRNGWTPRGGRANIKLVISSTAKDIVVTVSKDATNFTIIAPLQEPLDWSSKIDRGMKRGGK